MPRFALGQSSFGTLREPEWVVLHPSWLVAAGTTICSSVYTIRLAYVLFKAHAKHLVCPLVGVLLRWLSLLNLISTLAWLATYRLSLSEGFGPFLRYGHTFAWLFLTLINVTINLLMIMACRELCPAMLDVEAATSAPDGRVTVAPPRQNASSGGDAIWPAAPKMAWFPTITCLVARGRVAPNEALPGQNGTLVKPPLSAPPPLPFPRRRRSLSGLPATPEHPPSPTHGLVTASPCPDPGPGYVDGRPPPGVPVIDPMRMWLAQGASRDFSFTSGTDSLGSGSEYAGAHTSEWGGSSSLGENLEGDSYLGFGQGSKVHPLGPYLPAYEAGASDAAAMWLAEGMMLRQGTFA